jgi:hypothetical protein
MKVKALDGPKLDYWVARAAGHVKTESEWRSNWASFWTPSTEWGTGGPIIEQEHIAITRVPALKAWHASIWRKGSYERIATLEGDTALQAAMRVFVVSKFGEEVEDG